MRMLSRLFFALVILYGLAATVAFVAIRVVGDTASLTYAAGVLGFWWLLPTVPALGIAVARRRWWAFAAVVVPAVVWLWSFGVLFVPQPNSVIAQEGSRLAQVRVVTFNISPGPRISHVAELAHETGADILLLQEVGRTARTRLTQELDSYPHQWFAPISETAPGDGGVAVLSRFPIKNVEQFTNLPPGARPSGVVTVSVDGRPLDVVSLHLASPCRECAEDAILTGRLTEATQEGRTRIAEAKAIAPQLPDGPLVVGGDLNSATLNDPLPILQATGLTDAHRAVGWGPGFTRGARRTVAKIDFVLVDGGVIPTDSFEGAPGRSDHRPVVTDVLVPG